MTLEAINKLIFDELRKYFSSHLITSPVSPLAQSLAKILHDKWNSMKYNVSGKDDYDAAKTDWLTLDQLIEQARNHKMTPEEREEQRQSFAAGQAMDADSEHETIKLPEDNTPAREGDLLNFKCGFDLNAPRPEVVERITKNLMKGAADHLFPDEVIIYYPFGRVSPMSVCSELYQTDHPHRVYELKKELQPIETAPKNEDVLLYGYWNDKAATGQGTPWIGMASLTSYDSFEPCTYQWALSTSLCGIPEAVTVTHWRRP